MVHQDNIHLWLMIFFILATYLLENVLILPGEVSCWSLMEIKGTNVLYVWY